MKVNEKIDINKNLVMCADCRFLGIFRNLNTYYCRKTNLEIGNKKDIKKLRYCFVGKIAKYKNNIRNFNEFKVRMDRLFKGVG